MTKERLILYVKASRLFSLQFFKLYQILLNYANIVLK